MVVNPKLSSAFHAGDLCIVSMPMPLSSIEFVRLKKYKEVSNFNCVKCIGGIIVSAEPKQPIDAAKMSPKQISKGPPSLWYHHCFTMNYFSCEIWIKFRSSEYLVRALSKSRESVINAQTILQKNRNSLRCNKKKKMRAQNSSAQSPNETKSSNWSLRTIDIKKIAIF